MAQCESRGYRTILMNLRLYCKWGNTCFNDNERLKDDLMPVLQEALSIKVDGII